MVESSSSQGEQQHIHTLAVNTQNTTRNTDLEAQGEQLFSYAPATQNQPSFLSLQKRKNLLSQTLQPMLRRALQHQISTSEKDSYKMRLIGWLEVYPQDPQEP